MRPVAIIRLKHHETVFRMKELSRRQPGGKKRSSLSYKNAFATGQLADFLLANPTTTDWKTNSGFADIVRGDEGSEGPWE